MLRYKTIQYLLFMSMVLTSVCALSVPANAFSITFDLRGAEGTFVDGLVTGPITKNGLTATLSSNDGVLNQTAGGFGINALGAGDDTDTIDNGSGVTELITITFDQLVTFDQLILSSFTNAEDAILTIAGGPPITLVGTVPLADVYNFPVTNTIPIGQSVMLAYNTGNGFSFDEFTVTLGIAAVPEPQTVVLLIIGLAVLGGCFLKVRFKHQTKP
ncbi:hypothetical protein SCALIN_C14_0017 [Candidatus Scalindua japonica]|uniref:PEP-CTERM protein-sorting domain-containing protein n=1 Tax=Candidatus Scalindua japonica TaxID=1284222 RepID=A0A286TY14_9BACT|nr:PEP-CTERM sorting domain-containing protein [Candidatus Scalindua japonica]GAX60754.1 hypothetical protein SCALIN_C14_0017 [Candidatus Scalindua japonica]